MLLDGAVMLGNTIHGTKKCTNEDYSIDLQSYLTLQVESLHSIQHQKNINIPHMLEHAQSFGNTVKASLKKICNWSAYYFTGPNAYYTVPNNQVQFSYIPKLNPLPVVPMPRDQIKEMCDWAAVYGKCLKQRNIRQETCSYKAGTMPLYAYEKEEEIKDPIDLDIGDIGAIGQEDEYSSDSEEAAEEKVLLMAEQVLMKRTWLMRS